MTDAIALPPLALIVHAADRNIREPASLPAERESAEARTFGETLQREAPVLLAAARAITLDDAEAQDLVQTTFELALRHRGSLREPKALRGWLLTIQAREAFRVRRRLRRLVRLDADSSERTAGPAAHPDAIAIRDALRTLSPRVRAAIVLHHMAGLPVAEVAMALGVSQNTVKTQLRTGLARLRQVLGDD